jgi:type IV secretion system protein VirB2
MEGLSLNWGSKDFLVRICMVLMLTFALFMPIQSNADTTTNETEITKTLCNAVNQLTGTIGRSIAIIVVISMAIMLFLGKVSWGLAIATGVGMGILFGAKDVVDILSGDTACK